MIEVAVINSTLSDNRHCGERKGRTAEERTRAPDRIRIRGSGEHPPHCRPRMGGELSNEIGESLCSTVES